LEDRDLHAQTSLVRLSSASAGTTTIQRLLDQLDDFKNRFAPREQRVVERLLKRLDKLKIDDVDELIRLHELLLFLAAYPYNSQIKQLAESQLRNFANRLAALDDLTAFDNPEVSGVAGASVSDTFSYYIVRWLRETYPGRTTLDWDWFNDENRLAETWPRFMPLLEEDAYVEANVPYQTWLSAASGRKRGLPWLLKHFSSLPRSEKEIAELYDSQNLFVKWTPSYRTSRTGMRLPFKRRNFYHRGPLIQRRDVSLAAELKKPGSPALKLLSAERGETIINLARAASSLRYRELYGFTHGDPRSVLHANIGRGVDIFVISLPPERRLPLRAYHAAMIFKNGVPVGYFEGLSIFERMESGFNLYYTFRDGETAWLYAHTLNIFHRLLGVSVFTLDPYQIGYENEEGIESGAFWFYRKLGFRSVNPELMKLTAAEERKIAKRKGYRTAAHTLRKLATQPMVFELGETNTGDWDRFQLRNIGLAAQRRMAEYYDGEMEKFRSDAIAHLRRALGPGAANWPKGARAALADFAVTLSLIDDLAHWSAADKRMTMRIIRAKATSDESEYLRLMQKHKRLREALLRLGSS
jgi:hypothetical protein